MGAVVLDSSVFKIPWKSGLATEDPEITEEKICQRSSQSVPDDLRTDGLMTLTSRGYATPVAPKLATGATQRIEQARRVSFPVRSKKGSLADSSRDAQYDAKQDNAGSIKRLREPGSPRLFSVVSVASVVQILLQIGLRAMPVPGLSVVQFDSLSVTSLAKIVVIRPSSEFRR